MKSLDGLTNSVFGVFLHLSFDEQRGVNGRGRGREEGGREREGGREGRRGRVRERERERERENEKERESMHACVRARSFLRANDPAHARAVAQHRK